MFIAELVIEGDYVFPPIDRGIVLVQPVDPEDHWVVVQSREIQGYGFVVSLTNGEVGQGCCL